MTIENSKKCSQKLEPPQYAHRNSTSGSNIRKDNKKPPVVYVQAIS